jgi:hypothetical protein
MLPGQKGVMVIPKVNGSRITHWTLPQQAVAALDNTAGMPYKKLGHLGELYPPITAPLSSIGKDGKPIWGRAGSDPMIGGNAVGHWQWGNNLGSIKRFGYFSNSKTNDIVVIGQGVSNILENGTTIGAKLKKQLLKPSSLAGENCGYTPYGLGRNMLYYLEAYGRFYFICDPIKKKNVRNISFMCPGLRSTNSAIQYCWLGHPNNTYVERRAMYGPYAYQWRVRRHNRDRNGNGMSEGFYSMAYDAPFSLMYDAAAIFGLSIKKTSSQRYKTQVKSVLAARATVVPADMSVINLRYNWFGVGGTEGGAGNYGNFYCDPHNTTSSVCNYISAAQSLASDLDFEAYGCPNDRLQKGACFDPCLSIRYAQGFFPGGKVQDMFTNNGKSSQPQQMRLVSMANFNARGKVITEEEQSKLDPKVFFRSPVNTPHARITRGLNKVENRIYPSGEVVGMSPCRDGGSDHCNFLTPTIHLQTSSLPMIDTLSFLSAANYAANLYESYNIRGDES